MNSEDSSKSSIVKCCCCHNLCWDFDTYIVKCVRCQRTYHKSCYISNQLNFTSLFLCIMCQDIEEYSEDMKKSNTLFGYFKKKIIARILMELYCKSENTEHVKTCPNPQMYPMYYRKIREPMSLDNIRQFLEQDRYEQEKYVIWDMKKIFLNAMSYFSPDDPYYKVANELHVYLLKMVEKWLPDLVL